MKYVIGVCIIIADLFMLAALPAIMNLVTDFRTDDYTQTYIVATNATSVNGTVQLNKQLWEGSIVYAEVASNITSDTPALTDYNTDNRALTFNGLALNSSRLITVDYKSNGLTEFTGANQGSLIFPTVYILAVVLTAILSVVFIVIGR